MLEYWENVKFTFLTSKGMKFDIFPVCSRALGIFPLQTFDISTMGTCLNSKFFQFSQKFEKSEVF